MNIVDTSIQLLEDLNGKEIKCIDDLFSHDGMQTILFNAPSSGVFFLEVHTHDSIRNFKLVVYD
jgi:hypothetical protein